jgi:ornithine cyclodeaminase
MGCFAEGVPTIHAELGEVVSGKKPGRKMETDIIVSMNVGLSAEDVSVGHYVYQHAIKNGVGQRIVYS